jgi:2-polyprenyl-6-methoxyphenol hydroxylase-like FAD-dependent oxidoreductase
MARASDTVSTHALMRPGVMQLERWGVLDRLAATGTPPIRHTTFHYGAEAVGVPFEPRDGVDALYAARRTVLDAVLVDAAREAGVQVVHGAAVQGVLRDAAGRVCGAEIVDPAGPPLRVEAGVVIGADGAHSSVARAVGAGVVREGPHHASVIYGYWRGLRLGGTHWYFGPKVAGGAIPTNGGAACVFVAMPPARYQAGQAGGLQGLFDRVLAEVDPELAAATARGERVEKLRAFPGRPGFVRQAWGAGWALAGDAGCFKDPLTAHGMTDALRDAELLAGAVLEGSEGALARYQAERDAFALEFLDLSDAIASFAWDLEHVKALHRRLSALMGREGERVRAFGPLAPASGRARAA